MTEHDLQNAIIEKLQWQKIPVLRVNAGKFQNALTGSWIQGAESGHPDLVIGYPQNDIFLLGYVEVKSAVGVLNIDQIRVLRRIHKIGCPWLVARSIEDVNKWFADKSYHGDTKVIEPVLNEMSTFVPTQTKTRGKSTKMRMSTVIEHSEWSDKRDSLLNALDKAGNDANKA